MTANGSLFGTMERTGKVCNLVPRPCLTFHSAPGIISALPSQAQAVNGTLFYSSAPIVDSSGNVAFQVDLAAVPTGLRPPVPVQLLLCSQSLVNQQAVVDAQSHQLIAVKPNITKTASAWPSAVPLSSLDSYDLASTWPEMSLIDLVRGWVFGETI